MISAVRRYVKSLDRMSKSSGRSIHILLSVMLFVVVSAGQTNSLKSKVVLTGSGTLAEREKFGLRLTAIVNAIAPRDWDGIRDYCDPSGLSSLIDLVAKTDMKNVNPLYETKLLSLPGGGFEIRDIKIQVDMKMSRGNPFRYLVFTLDTLGRVSNVRFAISDHNYREIIGDRKAVDFAFRQQILQFIEIFRTAYNRKDLDYLKKVYSEDALIIVGVVPQKAPELPDYLETARLGREEIRLIRMSKQKYIKRLHGIFDRNECIKVRFEKISVMRHNTATNFYGVNLVQYWQVGHDCEVAGYYDVGYLFLMIQFRDEDEGHPLLIHVRAWQPDTFLDSSVVNLHDFIIFE